MAIKSAYELAMERMAKRTAKPARKLSNEEKVKLADLERVFTAKIAERELALKPKIAEAIARGESDAAQKLEEQLRAETKRIRRDLEEQKETIRQGK